MRIKLMKVSELHIDPANVRSHDTKNLDAIAASLTRFGQQKPIVVSPAGVVLAGNGTLSAAKRLGWSSIRVVKTSLENAEATAYAIADNRTGELASWDDDALATQLSALQIEDETLLEAMGFTDEELVKILEGGDVFDAAEVPLPDLPDGDRVPYQQRTFVLHDDQCEDIERALDTAKEMGHSQSAINENSNGNALAFICQHFVRTSQ